MKIWITGLCVALGLIATVRADPSIVEIQRALKEQGFYYGQISGQKDADTTAAIRRYQIRNGLEINGELTEETLSSIRSTEKQASKAPQPVPAPQPEQGNSDLRADAGPRDRQIAPPSGQPALPPNGDQWFDQPNPGRRIPSGGGVLADTPYQTAPVEVQRRVIADAQRILARRGLFREEVDGAFGPALEFSLRAYQSRVGLPVNGRLDLETLAALQLLPGARGPIYTPRRPILRPEPPVRGEWVRP